MNYESECPRCGQLNIMELTTWDDNPAHPCFCKACDYFFWIRKTADVSETITIESTYTKHDTDIPPLPLKTAIYISNKEHKFFLEQGIIIKKDHKHYRIKFISQNEKIRDKCLWVPDHWVAKIPKEYLI